MKTNIKNRELVLATIDELNQYLNGNVTDIAVLMALRELWDSFPKEI